MSTETTTITIPTKLAWRLKAACFDSSSVWHDHWREVAEGRRDDLDRDACSSLSRDAWKLWEILHDQGI